MKTIDSLGRLAADTAMKGAADYVRIHKIDAGDCGRLCELIRVHIKAGIDSALDDAKAALDAGMGQVAEQTFLASMKLAGINAAKEFAGVV